MPSIAQIWDRLERWFSDNTSIPVLAMGATRGEIHQIETNLKVKLPEDIIATYLRHNGCVDTASLFLNGSYLLPLDEIQRNWSAWCDLNAEQEDEMAATGEIKDMEWNTKWVPLSDTGSGDHYCVDLDPGMKGTIAQIIEFSHEEGALKVLASGFTAFLNQLVDVLENGEFKYVDGEFMRLTKPSSTSASP